MSWLPHLRRDIAHPYTKVVSRKSPRGWRRGDEVFCLEHIQDEGEYILGDEVDDDTVECHQCGKKLSKAVSIYTSQTIRSGKTTW